MFTQKLLSRSIRAAAFSIATLLSMPAVQAHVSDASAAIDIARLGKAADFVFKGTVTKVEYKNSASVPTLNALGRPVIDADGQPVLEDGSDLPHTFVTFRIEETYKGRAQSGEITLRFLGGLDDKAVTDVDDAGNTVVAPDIFMASATPLFDVGDRDTLFVKGNTVSNCPLVNCIDGRFRVLSAARTETPKIFTDRGEELTLLNSGRVTLGAVHLLPEVDSNQIGEFKLKRVLNDAASSGDESGADGVVLPNIKKGRQFGEAQFAGYVRDRMARNPQPGGGRVPVASANIRQPFIAPALHDSLVAQPRFEQSRPVPRPWLNKLRPVERAAILAAENAERAALEANGGDPVIAPRR